MKAELRPKIYLALCLIALTLEGLYIFLNRPLACIKCKSALVTPSQELPQELCQPCVELLRAAIAPAAGQSVIVEKSSSTACQVAKSSPMSCSSVRPESRSAYRFQPTASSLSVGLVGLPEFGMHSVGDGQFE